MSKTVGVKTIKTQYRTNYMV